MLVILREFLIGILQKESDFILSQELDWTLDGPVGWLHGSFIFVLYLIGENWLFVELLIPEGCYSPQVGLHDGLLEVLVLDGSELLLHDVWFDSSLHGWNDFTSELFEQINVVLAPQQYSLVVVILIETNQGCILLRGVGISSLYDS